MVSPLRAERTVPSGKASKAASHPVQLTAAEKLCTSWGKEMLAHSPATRTWQSYPSRRTRPGSRPRASPLSSGLDQAKLTVEVRSSPLASACRTEVDAGGVGCRSTSCRRAVALLVPASLCATTVAAYHRPVTSPPKAKRHPAGPHSPAWTTATVQLARVPLEEGVQLVALLPSSNTVRVKLYTAPKGGVPTVWSVWFHPNVRPKSTVCVA
mmetsp:Transcript_120/g.321  ORF Transcript_120/g.321 Transcript_120/m.321 type:complete len:211 (+) Transcript_120:382-1014(+)